MNRLGFTLIELLVVISIIAVLAGMLLPAVGLVRGGAKASVCASNQRQVAMAIVQYADDNDGLFPTGIDVGNWTGGICWNQKINTYLDSDVGGAVKTMICPEDARAWILSPRSYIAVAIRDNPNGTKDGWTGTNTSRPMSALSRKTATVLLIENWESSAGFDPYTVGFQWSPNCATVTGWLTSAIAPYTKGGRSPYYHGSKNNYAYADGHVEAKAPGALFRSGTDNDWRVNW